MRALLLCLVLLVGRGAATAAPSAAPTAAPTTAAPTHAPSSAPTAEPTTAAPTASPTAAPTSAAAQVVNVTYNATASYAVGGDAGPLVVSAGDQTLRLDHASTAVNVSLTVYRHDDATASSHSGCGALVNGIVAAQALAVRNYASDGFRYNLSWNVDWPPYTTPDRVLYTCVAGELVTVASVCAAIEVDQAPTTNGTGLSDAVVCGSGYLVLVEPENARRTCLDGTYGCQCTRTDAYAAMGGHGWLVYLGLLLISLCGLYVLWNETAIGVPTLVPPFMCCCTRCYENTAGDARCCCRCVGSRLCVWRHALAQFGIVVGVLFLTAGYTFYLDRDERAVTAYWRCDDTKFREFAWGMTGAGLVFYLFGWIAFFPWLWNDSKTGVPIANDNVAPDPDKQAAHLLTRLFMHVVYAAALLPFLAATGGPFSAWYTESLLLVAVPLLVSTIMAAYWMVRCFNRDEAVDVLRAGYFIFQPLITLMDVLVFLAVWMRAVAWPCGTSYRLGAACPA